MHAQLDVGCAAVSGVRTPIHLDEGKQEEGELVPTIEEQFEGIVEYMQRAIESPCPDCNGTLARVAFVESRRVCNPCDGTGKWRIEGEEHECELCHGHGEYTLPEPMTVPCECGDGVRHVGRYDPVVVSAVLNACISGMHTARECGDFDKTNRILDWAMGYCTAAAKEALQRVELDPGLAEEAMERFRKAGSPDPADLGTKLVGGALTQEELDRLLKEDDQG